MTGDRSQSGFAIDGAMLLHGVLGAVVAASRASQRSDFLLSTVGSGRFSAIQFVLLRAS